MTVYNDAPYIASAVESVLGQSFEGFEFIIVDDGSTDATAEVLRTFHDPRLRLEFSATNRGISAQANRGLDLARGRYIARMDGDDLCLPGRLEAQVAAMDAHPEVGLCGAQVERFADSGPERAPWNFPLEHERIQVCGLFRGPFCNPVTMLRRSVLEEHDLRYDPSYPLAEDMHLWYRLLKVARGLNLPATLLRYRVSESQVTRTEGDQKAALWERLHRLMLADLGLPLDASALGMHASALGSSWPPDRAFFERAIAWLDRLREANRSAAVYGQEALEEALREHLYWRCRMGERRGLPAFRLAREAGFSGSLSLRDRLRSLLKRSLKPAGPSPAEKLAPSQDGWTR